MKFLRQLAKYKRLEQKRHINMKTTRYIFVIREEANEPKIVLGSLKHMVLYNKNLSKTLNTLFHIEGVPLFS
jgi:predicted GTPase